MKALGMRYRAMWQVKRMGMYYLLWMVLKLYSYEAGNWDCNGRRASWSAFGTHLTTPDDPNTFPSEIDAEIPKEDNCSKYCSQGAPVVVSINHGTERFDARPIFSERESNPDTTSEWFVLLADSVYIALLLAYLGIFGHILRRGKIVVISGVLIVIKGRNEWRRCPSKIVP